MTALVAGWLLACITCLPVAVFGGALADLPHLKDFTAARESSCDPSGGNADGRHDRPIQPVETRTIADLPRAGAIVHLWFTIASRDTNHLKNLVLRAYWDGEATPSVEAPLGDFFGLGHARYYQYWSTPIQIGVDKGLNCFWRMPFTNGARLTVSNDGPLPVLAFYYYVDYQKPRNAIHRCRPFSCPVSPGVSVPQRRQLRTDGSHRPRPLCRLQSLDS